MTRRKPHSKIGPSSGQSDAVTAPWQYARALHHTQERYALSRVNCGDAIYTNTFPTLYTMCNYVSNVLLIQTRDLLQSPTLYIIAQS